MSGKIGKILLLIAILFFAASAVLVVRQIKSSRQQLTISDPGFVNYLVQLDHLTDELDRKITDFIDSTSLEDRQETWKVSRRGFDILWSLLKVSDVWRPGFDERVDGAEELADSTKEYLRVYNDLFLMIELPSSQTVVQSREDLRTVAKQIHPVGLAFFQRISRFEDDLQAKLEWMYRYLLTASLFVFVASSILVAQLYASSRRSQALFEDAESSRKQLALVIEELRSGKQERKAKDSFLAAASHDLRQPLHALGLFVNALDNKVSTPDGPVILDKIRQSTEALNSLFNSLLDISKLDAGVVQIDPIDFEIKTLFDNVEQEFRQLAQQRQLDFSIEHSNQIARTDFLLLSRIVRNLIDNAIVHTSSGNISVVCIQKNEVLEVSVTDTGPGIPKAEQNSVFSEYYQLHNPERDRSKGLGLGLSIVKRLTELLDLKLTLDSTIGKGTTFRISIPVGDVAKVGTLSDSETFSSAKLDLHGMTVLVIDDEKDVRDAMKLLLGSVNSVAITTESAEAARELLVEENLVPELIIADYRLREGRTGEAAIELIRDEMNKDIPAIIITGDTSPERVRMATESGFALLHKPVAPDELTEAIRQLVQSSNSADQASA